MQSERAGGAVSARASATSVRRVVKEGPSCGPTGRLKDGAATNTERRGGATRRPVRSVVARPVADGQP